jgi:hypothetical protein
MIVFCFLWMRAIGATALDNSTHVEPSLPSLHKLEMCLQRLVGLPLSFAWIGAGYFQCVMFGNGNVFLGNWFPFPGIVFDTLCLETETCFLETGFRFQGLFWTHYIWKRKRVSWKTVSVSRVC